MCPHARSLPVDFEFRHNRELGRDNPVTTVVFLVLSRSVMDTGTLASVTASPPINRVACSCNSRVRAPPVAPPANSIEQMAKDAITFIKAMGFE